ncbi:hypothetical protein THIX_20084 [Thiomonas sp. X19]|nr:hypothetical protein THIX_20084 [Thiomonas sp. X19]
MKPYSRFKPCARTMNVIRVNSSVSLPYTCGSSRNTTANSSSTISPGRRRRSREGPGMEMAIGSAMGVGSGIAHRLAQQAGGTDEHDDQQQHVRHEVGPGGVVGLHQHRAQAEHQAADDRAQRVAQRADDDDGERGGGEFVAQVRRDRAEQIRQEHPGRAGQRQAGDEGDDRDAVDADAGGQRLVAVGHDGARGVTQLGVREVQIQPGDGGQAEDRGHPPAVGKLLAEQADVAGTQRLARQRALVGAEGQPRERFEHLADAEEQDEGQHLRVTAALQARHHGVIQRIADDDGTGDGQRHAPQRVETEVPRDDPGGIATEHDELPMRQVDDAHDAKNQIQPDADQAEKNAVQNAADDGVCEQFQTLSLIDASSKRPQRFPAGRHLGAGGLFTAPGEGRPQGKRRAARPVTYGLGAGYTALPVALSCG